MTAASRTRVVLAGGRRRGEGAADARHLPRLPRQRAVVRRTRGVYASRLWEFLSGDPRESNTEGGIFPAIFGTVMMVMLMSVLAVPFGVLAALYLREYARQGVLVRIVRIAVNNLAGVPSIVFGVFGLGFFVYFVGGVDRPGVLHRAPADADLRHGRHPVGVADAGPADRAGGHRRDRGGARRRCRGRCARPRSRPGATKFQTILRVVLPAAAPGILTGLILAMARGAGEVAPLMITGVVKLAPDLPLDGVAPFLHLERKFMHLGFHIYDVGFQSPNVEAAKPMVYATADPAAGDRRRAEPDGDRRAQSPAEALPDVGVLEPRYAIGSQS